MSQLNTVYDEVILPGQLAARLVAAERLETVLVTPDCEIYWRLEQQLENFPIELREAVRRSLLHVRRSSNQWSLLSGAGVQGGTDPEHRDLREVDREMARGDFFARVELVESLMAEEFFGAAPVLVTYLVREQDPLAKAALAKAVGYLGGDAVLGVLKGAVRDPIPEARLGAIEGLRHQCGPGAVGLLIERLADSLEPVRRAAREALRSRSPESCVAVLRQIPPGRGGSLVRAALDFLEPWCHLLKVRQLLSRWTSRRDPAIVNRSNQILLRCNDTDPDLSAPSYPPERKALFGEY